MTRARPKRPPMKGDAKPLLAFEATDGGDSWAIVFATNGAAARRDAANEMGTDFEGVESCRRKPVFDRWAPGPVPIQAQFEAGWWFECMGCNCRVSQDADFADRFDDAAEPELLNPVFYEHAVYCTPECQARDDLERANRSALEATTKLEMARIVHERFPGAVIKNLNAYCPSGSVNHAITEFMVPGLQYGARYDHQKPGSLLIAHGDLAAWERYRDRLELPLRCWEDDGGPAHVSAGAA